jgi:hypothetical protein
MNWQLQQVSNYGTATPAVARTLVQGAKILGFFRVPEAQKEEAEKILYELQRQLVRCVEVRDGIASRISAGRRSVVERGLEFQSQGQAVTLPSVPDLSSKAEGFLQSAKLAIRETARLVKPFYGVTHDHRYHRFVNWAEERFGADDTFAKAVRNWEPWVKTVVTMRNAVDHPSDKPGGKLFVRDFQLGGTRPSPQLIDPMWGLCEPLESFMLPHMNTIVDRIIELGEEILAGLFEKQKSTHLVVLYEIPPEKRDESCPIRLQVGPAGNPPDA